MKTRGKRKTHSSPRTSKSTKAKPKVLSKARSALKRAERVNTPLSAKRKLMSTKETGHGI